MCFVPGNHNQVSPKHRENHLQVLDNKVRSLTYGLEKVVLLIAPTVTLKSSVCRLLSKDMPFLQQSRLIAPLEGQYGI